MEREVGRRCALGADEVHVWLVSPDSVRSTALIAALHRLLSAEERGRRQRFHFEKGRHECLVSCGLVRTVLSRYADVAPEAWSFVENEYGRPEIAPGLCALPLRFNLAHTDGLIALGVTLERDLGVDVERLQRKVEGLSLADHFFSPTEASDLRALPEDLQQERFFSYWTLKESYIKARGMGLSLPLDHFSFHLAEGMPIRISFDPRMEDDPSAWQFELARPTPEHLLAVSVRNGSERELAIDVRETVPLLD